MTLIKQWTKPVLIILVSFLVAWLLPSGPVDPWGKNLIRTLHKSNYKIYGSDGTAQLLGNKPTTLISRIKSLEILMRPQSAPE